MFGIFWLVFKMAGLAPWRINKRGALGYNWWCIATGYALLFGAIAHHTYSYVNDQHQIDLRDAWKNSATARVVGYIDFGTMCISSFVCLVATTSQTKNIFRIVDKFQELKSYHKIPDKPFRFRHAILLGLFMTSLVTYDLVIGGPANCESLFGVWYLRFFLYGSEVVFTSTVLTLYELFQNVNAQLRLNVPTKTTDARHVLQVLPFVDFIKGFGQTGNPGPNRSPVALRELSAVHWKLCKIGQEINAAFNGQLLTLFVTLTVRVVTIPYFLFLMVDTNKPVSTHAIAANAGWAVAHALQLCLLVWPCSLASDEAGKTSTIIVHNLNKPLPADSRKQMEMFLVQLTNHKLDFHVYDMFTIDLTVMTSVAGAVTTYLVILIQFQNSQPQME